MPMNRVCRFRYPNDVGIGVRWTRFEHVHARGQRDARKRRRLRERQVVHSRQRCELAGGLRGCAADDNAANKDASSAMVRNIVLPPVDTNVSKGVT